MDNLSISKALLNLVPGALWTLRGDNYADLEWESDGKPPTIAEIEAEINKLPAKEKAKADKLEADKALLLTKLGITEDEARLLLS